MKEEKRRGTLGWVMDFAGMNKNAYLASVIMAIISVAAGFVSYLFVANIIRALTDGNRDMPYSRFAKTIYAIPAFLKCFFSTLAPSRPPIRPPARYMGI